MYQNVVDTKENEHKCFYCKEIFKYKIDVKTGRRNYGLFQVTNTNVPTAKYAFVDNSIVEVDIACPVCDNINRFKLEL